MPIPDERLPDFDEADEDAVNSSADPEMLDEDDELEFESADADEASVILEPDEAEDTASFGYGDPVE